jgi:oligoribonuclease (3'-5' exoribonuclease)
MTKEDIKILEQRKIEFENIKKQLEEGLIELFKEKHESTIIVKTVKENPQGLQIDGLELQMMLNEWRKSTKFQLPGNFIKKLEKFLVKFVGDEVEIVEEI